MFHSNTNGTQNVNEKAFCERYPLHRACRDGDLQTLALFVATTGDRQRLLEEDSFYGWTPLHWAAYFGKISCLMQVCEAGIGIDIKTRFRQTASHIAAFSNAGNGLKWLLQNAAPINEQLECLSKLTNLAEGFNFDIASSHFSQTLLHIVAFKGYLHCLQWLLQVGANSNKQDHLGETPLHKAARTGSMECLSLLSSAGANILITNNNGLTASNLAAIAGNTEASEYLKQMEDCHPNPNGFRNSFDKTAFLNGSFNEKDFIKQGLNGGHLPECVIWNGICQRNGIPTNGHCEMSVNLLQKQNPQPNGFCSINGMNGHTKNGFSFPQPMMGGCKRPYEDRIQEEVKRIRTVEGFQSQAEYRCAAFYSNGHKKPTLPMHNSVVEHQAIMAMENNYNMLTVEILGELFGHFHYFLDKMANRTLDTTRSAKTKKSFMTQPEDDSSDEELQELMQYGQYLMSVHKELMIKQQAKEIIAKESERLTSLAETNIQLLDEILIAERKLTIVKEMLRKNQFGELHLQNLEKIQPTFAHALNLYTKLSEHMVNIKNGLPTSGILIGKNDLESISFQLQKHLKLLSEFEDVIYSVANPKETQTTKDMKELVENLILQIERFLALSGKANNTITVESSLIATSDVMKKETN